MKTLFVRARSAEAKVVEIGIETTGSVPLAPIKPGARLSGAAVLVPSFLPFLIHVSARFHRYTTNIKHKVPPLRRSPAGGPAFHLDRAYKAGAPFFVYVAKGGNHERVR